ncbi:MAG: hypothetical protein V7L05_09365 [Nostoc sp.]|uniref:hypothetical protein n=1 Tax=Nostoc sp. TaxID=1180 RepID=UPI002FF77ECB
MYKKNTAVEAIALLRPRQNACTRSKTTQSGSWVFNNPSLYPRLLAGAGGLPLSSILLLDQTRGLDINRVLAYLGTLTSEQYVPITNGLRQLFRQ